MLEYFRGGGGSQILMLQDIRRQGLGKSGLKFRHGGRGYQNWPKNSDVFYGRPHSTQGLIKTLGPW